MSLTRKQRTTVSSRLARVTKIVESLPEATIEPYGLGHHVIRVRKKTFAYHTVDHHGDGRIALWCKAERVEQQRLVRSDATTFFVPPYLGPSGWVGVRLDVGKVDWRAVEDLLVDGYSAVAPVKLVAMLEQACATIARRRR